MNRVQEALALRKMGWNVVAAPKGGKSPRGSWKRWQTELITERTIRESFGTGDEPNIFIITGSVSRLCVLDCDDERAQRWWRERLGSVLDETTAVPTTRGCHYYFRLPRGKVVLSRKAADDEQSGSWDLQAEGKGVVAPPSIHETGRIYAWADGRGPEALRDAPSALFDVVVEAAGGDQPRSLLNQLLGNPPVGDASGRNVWLTKVAGHYALHIPHQDAYETMVRQAAEKLIPPLPEAEISKLIRSIWSTEQAKLGREVAEIADDDGWRQALAEPREETGWLVSGGNRVLVQIRKKTESGHELGLRSWMDADMKVFGIIDKEGDRVYETELRRATGERIEAALPAKAIADARRLAEWLGNYGVSIGSPDDMWPAKMREGSRLLRYLEAQKAPALIAVPALGWHEPSQAFITHAGVIKDEGPKPFEEVRPDPAIRNWAPYRYGFISHEEAQTVLAKVLEFHNEGVAAVFGSWCVAAILKPQIMKEASQFPFMALEAASESGKTTGFFPLMLQLTGYDRGQTNQTRAALRDSLSAHNSGIVWMDDLDDLEAHGELLRNVTVGGSLIKKGEGNHEQVVAQMRAALVISGEGLGLHGQKALLDRAVLVEVPSPTGRMSKDGTRPQWDEILELRTQYPNLTDFAGNIVQLCLQRVDMVHDLKKYRRGTGRFADKIAVLRLGARILGSVLGDTGAWVVDAVDSWCGGLRDPGNENVLTMKLIPWALAQTGWKTKPEGPDDLRRQVATPVFIQDDAIVWFSPRWLSEWFQRQPPFRTDQRVHSEQALTQQARAMGLGGEKQQGGPRQNWKYITNDGRHIYWSCPKELSALLIERSHGEDPDPDTIGEDAIF